MSSLKAFIADLQRDPRFKGTCPACMEDFRLADAVLFAWSDQPPQAALQALHAMQERVKERKRELVRNRELMTKIARRTAQAVNLGKIVEKIVPSFASFAYEPGNCPGPLRADRLPGLLGTSPAGSGPSSVLCGRQSGNARLSRAQTSIKKAVESGAVRFGMAENGD